MSSLEMDESDNLVVFDTDGGTDDAWALFMLLKADQERTKNVRLLGVTCVHGNTQLQNVVRNVFRVLDAAERLDVPVFKGAATSLLPRSIEDSFFHGVDGFGDIYEHDDDEKVFSRMQKQHAVTAMYELACKYPKRVTFILVGPLTNFALCMKMYADFAEKVKEVYIMGGNRKGVGNITACAEFNFYYDPEAAFIVMNEDCITKTILPWEPCLPKKRFISLDWRLNFLSSTNSPATLLMDQVEKKCYEESSFDGWCPCDAYLMAAFLFPELIIKKESTYHVLVELAGFHTRGQMILDHIKTKKDNARVIEQVDLDNFKKIAMWIARHDVTL